MRPERDTVSGFLPKIVPDLWKTKTRKKLLSEYSRVFQLNKDRERTCHEI
ncbi:hypothetical protein SUBVAR_07117 [Subdoligranulum variabile DSM 15176]|uniref:Uncharacterized protein n=1 Tax=Subdoligranulum variabile DSM 15176 TaxID=411471 RepID=D1PRN2_9FIRM|nr:hypothetical protein SUBVAR_07117 [Subdoligranulum variabile DSM 15176]